MYPARHGKLWTVEEMWELSELYQQDITWNSIAVKMKRTISACKSRMYVIRLAFLLMNDVEGQTIMDALSRRVHNVHQ